MRGFLDELAAELYGRYGEQVSELSILFPSQRARIFFTQSLAQLLERPVWQPQWITIDEIMGELSQMVQGERIRLITELYSVYSQYHKETFDKFYFWGEMLLSDFDTIDKYRVDASMLFRNLTDIKLLEADISHLTPAQLKIVAFWSSLSADGDEGAKEGEKEELSEQKKRFLAIWQTLLPIYTQFRERLQGLGIAYNGQMQRAAVEALQRGEGGDTLHSRNYIIAGFNALTECERGLFNHLSNSSKVDFYWDYDIYYTSDLEQESGRFLRKNIRQFPPSNGISCDNLSRLNSIECVATASDALQCRYVGQLLQKMASEKPLDKGVAVILTDEQLLTPLLYALPEDIGPVNVTMGYPLRQTLAYTIIERLLSMQSNANQKGDEWQLYHIDVMGILSHPYLAEHNSARVAQMRRDILQQRRIRIATSWIGVDTILSDIFSVHDSWQALSDYLLRVVSHLARLPYEGDDVRQRVEFLASIAQEITTLKNSLERCEIELSIPIYSSLLRRHLQTVRVPYEGEPLQGVQVMGILESRNIDFERVIILSCNDDNLPSKGLANSSYIPYSLRSAYDMPTVDDHEAIYAYYFYRLIQRAESVTLLYCSKADEKRTGEPTRYIHQLEYESGIQITHTNVAVDVNLLEQRAITVVKDSSVMSSLERFIHPDSTASLSPTALFRYVACPLSFYLSSIARLRTEDELEEAIDASMFGNILHDAAQSIYAPLVGDANPSDYLKRVIDTKTIEREVERAINENYLRQKSAKLSDYSGNTLLVHDIVVRYLRRSLLPYDIKNSHFSVQGVEQRVEFSFPFKTTNGDASVRFSGIADRIDSQEDGTLRVVDYKTGRAQLDFAGVEALFRGEAKHRQSNIMQTLLYSMMLYHTQCRDVRPALYYVRDMNQEWYSPYIMDRHLSERALPYSHYREEFEGLLTELLSEIFNPNIPFTQCEDIDRCTYCDFNPICKRG